MNQLLRVNELAIFAYSFVVTLTLRGIMNSTVPAKTVINTMNTSATLALSDTRLIENEKTFGLIKMSKLVIYHLVVKGLQANAYYNETLSINTDCFFLISFNVAQLAAIDEEKR